MPKRPKVLVVDDEQLNLEVLEAMLVPLGYDVTPAHSGAECLEQIAGDAPDVVLLDVMMPSMDGFEVCRGIKDSAKTRDVPVVMVTALRDVQHRVRALDVGADDFLSKPVAKPELLARVRSSTELKSYRDAEKQLLADTLNGVIEVLTEILAAIEQPVFSAALEVRRLVAEFGPVVGLESTWGAL